MKFASPPSVVLGVLVAVLFATRAITGWLAESANDQGKAFAEGDHHAEAAPLLIRGAVGANRTAGLWWGGQELLADWDTMPGPDQFGARGAACLRAAATRFLEGRAASAASPAFLAGLGQVYDRRESVARADKTMDLADIERGPWGVVGDDGRIAIGLTRIAIAREPNSFEFRDQLVFFFDTMGLRDDSLRAMDDAARVLPDFDQHPNFIFERLPRELVERFWQTSRSLDSGDAPFQYRERHLLSLGTLGRRLGHLDEAEADLRKALESPGTAIFHAEDAFHLGLVLVDRGRFDDAEPMLARADLEPVFRAGVAETRARIAEKRERWTEALDYLREARRLTPRDLGVLLEFARMAHKAQAWDQAEEALRWSILLYPGEPAPRRALIELFVAKGERQAARKELDAYVQALGKNSESAAMEQAVGLGLDPAVR